MTMVWGAPVSSQVRDSLPVLVYSSVLYGLGEKANADKSGGAVKPATIHVSHRTVRRRAY